MRTGASRDHNTYDGTGHCPHWEQAERTAAELTGLREDQGRQRRRAKRRAAYAGNQERERAESLWRLAPRPQSREVAEAVLL